MLSITVFMCCLLLAAGISTRDIRKIKQDVRELEAGQDELFTEVEGLKKNLTARIDNIEAQAVAKFGGDKLPVRIETDTIEPAADDVGLAARLELLESNMEVIKNYLMGEKKNNLKLRDKSEEIINEMNGKAVETEALVDSMKEHVKLSIEQFGTIVRAVNQSAHSRNVNVLGVVYNGGIGSTCSRGNDECVIERSACREGKCQCHPGLSYNDATRECVEQCADYGKMYQTVNNYIIRGYNNANATDVSASECKWLCFLEESFLCVTIDYFPRWGTCYLSNETKSDVPEDSWEYNGVGRHFQRDCN